MSKLVPMNDGPVSPTVRLPQALLARAELLARLTGEPRPDLLRTATYRGLAIVEHAHVTLRRYYAEAALEALPQTHEAPIPAELRAHLAIIQRGELETTTKAWERICDYIQRALAEADDTATVLFENAVVTHVMGQKLPDGVPVGEAARVVRTLIGQARYARIWGTSRGDPHDDDRVGRRAAVVPLGPKDGGFVNTWLPPHRRDVGASLPRGHRVRIVAIEHGAASDMALVDPLNGTPEVWLSASELELERD